jgi:hypothetical protein
LAFGIPLFAVAMVSLFLVQSPHAHRARSGGGASLEAAITRSVSDWSSGEASSQRVDIAGYARILSVVDADFSRWTKRSSAWYE